MLFILTNTTEFINAILPALDMGNVLRAESLWKVYYTHESTVEAVRGVDLRINEGEIIAIMGPSGCGKTTLLNVLSGIDDPSAGDVLVNEVSLYQGTENQRTDLRAQHFGFIYQNFNLLPVLTAAENVEMPLLLNGVSPQEARRRSVEALHAVGLSERVKHRPAELSGGQQQRVAIARALVTKAPLIVADEPTGDLDRDAGSEILELLAETNREFGRTVVMVTHDPKAAARAKTVVHFEKGKLEVGGTSGI
jgi:putative ABC transport system ATP-binding protein